MPGNTPRKYWTLLCVALMLIIFCMAIILASTVPKNNEARNITATIYSAVPAVAVPNFTTSMGHFGLIVDSGSTSTFIAVNMMLSSSDQNARFYFVEDVAAAFNPNSSIHAAVLNSTTTATMFYSANVATINNAPNKGAPQNISVANMAYDTDIGRALHKGAKIPPATVAVSSAIT